VEAKTRTPGWRPPEWSPLHSEDPAFFIPFGEAGNPYSAGLLSLAESDGIAIHGVNFDPQLGTRASHGCIRVEDSALLWMYDRVPIGTPVFIY
jgi:lipoprotein-anchoring transpeptidase ErfK/SrfK